MRRGSEFTFAQVPIADIPRSTFNRSHGHKTTFDAGYLIPVYVDEVLPGDTFNVNMSCFARLSTPIVPLMDNLYMDAFFFFVPNRLLWSNWQRFMGERDPDPDSSTDYIVPVVAGTNYAVGSLGDYFGIPTGINNIEAAALHFRAYNLIWNQWFRDENLQDSAPFSMGDGPDAAGSYVLLRRGKRHDYFTSCLPWPQKGDAIELSIGSTAPVTITGSGAPTFQGSSNNPPTSALKVANASAAVILGANNTSGGTKDLNWVTTNLSGVADLSSATAATINSLRVAFQMQRMLERDARGGTRYTEILRSHFGVVSPDARLQRPEYLGGGTVPVIVNPVAQTSSTDATTPQGHLAAFGVAGGSGLGFTKSFVEHGVLIGMVCVRGELSYQQGLHKMWDRRTRVDFYWPAFSHLGEQAVLNQEIYAQGNATDDEVFGYQERWAEYRYFPSKITGKFRSTYATPLDVWHLGQEFSALPTLSPTFIEENPPVSRIVAVSSEPHFLFDSHFRIRCVRPMPTYSVPGLIDHF